MAIDETRLVERTMELEARLADAILTAFARGVNIERTWHIESPVADAPSWRISISREETDKDGPYDATMVENCHPPRLRFPTDGVVRHRREAAPVILSVWGPFQSRFGPDTPG